MSQTNYYVRLGMQLMGPFSLDQLRVLKDRGRLQPFHSISTDGRTWQPASTLTELFPPEPSPASANPAPSVAPGAPAAVGPEQDTWYYLDANGQQAGPSFRLEIARVVSEWCNQTGHVCLEARAGPVEASGACLSIAESHITNNSANSARS
jgi:hypothetical protein